MLAEEFNSFVGKKPFRPYRITLTDGRTYDIMNYDFGVVGFDSVIVGISPTDEKEPDSVREILVSLSHVMQIEFIDIQASASGVANHKE
jgi:hypothetical protein